MRVQYMTRYIGNRFSGTDAEVQMTVSDLDKEGWEGWILSCVEKLENGKLYYFYRVIE